MVVSRRKALPFVLRTKLGLQEIGRPSLKGMAPWPGPCEELRLAGLAILLRRVSVHDE
jgi:hypothetical protein